MKFSFIVPCSPTDQWNVEECIDSIEAQVESGLDDYDIVVVGSVDVKRDNTRVIEFDEDSGPGKIWLTRKKNIGASVAYHPNLVFMHSYYRLLPGWHEGIVTFGEDWDVCMTRVLNKDGTRFRDWCLTPKIELPSHRSRERLMPYDFKATKNLYVSGGYWLAKKKFMERYPLDERLVWGQSEDVEWSARALKRANYRMNPGAAVGLAHMKWVSFVEARPDMVRRLA